VHWPVFELSSLPYGCGNSSPASRFQKRLRFVISSHVSKAGNRVAENPATASDERLADFDFSSLPGIRSSSIRPIERDEQAADTAGCRADCNPTLSSTKGIAPGRATSAGGKITLPPGQSPAEEFAMLSHGLAHLCSDEIYVAKLSEMQNFGFFRFSSAT
jgi:hypothetical protein